LDNKSVQSLAKDLAAECAKAYELMESSLSKLTNDFSIGPFGLTPKNKVSGKPVRMHAAVFIACASESMR
jgi:hypothetical protein